VVRRVRHVHRVQQAARPDVAGVVHDAVAVVVEPVTKLLSGARAADTNRASTGEIAPPAPIPTFPDAERVGGERRRRLGPASLAERVIFVDLAVAVVVPAVAAFDTTVGRRDRGPRRDRQ
jgi:hypothetical protein